MELKKGIKLNPNQNGCGSREARYDFYYRYCGEKCRVTVICKSTAVNARFDRWKDEEIRKVDAAILAAAEAERLRAEEAERAKLPRLFENIDEYLLHIERIKSKDSIRQANTVCNKLVKVFFDKNKLTGDITHSDIEDYIQWRRKYVIAKYENTKVKGEISNATINRDLAVISDLIKYCIRRGYYYHLNPCSYNRLPEKNYREVYLAEEQIVELIDAASTVRKMCHLSIMLLLLTGMRRGELFNLTWTEVNFDTRFIVLSQYKTKGKKSRAIPISPTVKEVLLILKNMNSSPLVMGNYTVNMLAKDWKKVRKLISFPLINDGTNLRVHDCRHVFCQSLLNLGVSLEDVQSLAGHQDFTTTQRRYAQFARPDLLEKGSKIDNVIKFRKTS